MDSNSISNCDSSDDDLDCVHAQFIIGIEKVNAVGDRLWIPNVPDDKRPMVGMVFNSLPEAWLFFEYYASVGGFEPIKSTQKPPSGKPGGQLVQLKIYECAKGGKKRNKSQRLDSLNVPIKYNQCDIGTSKKTGDVLNSVDDINTEQKKVKKRNCSSKKTGCRANMRLSLTPDMKYYVYQFIEEHNHCLVHPGYMQHLNVSRKVNFAKKRLLHKMNDASVGSSVGHKILSKVSGSENVGFTKTDAKNYKRDVLAFIGDYDCQMVVELLTKKKMSISDFSFDYFLDSENSLAGFFWADEYAKRNYHAFGDAVSFDATYRTNKYDMVFIPFTGIDNHMKCITFGAGMLCKENVSSYKWLLNAFIKAFPHQPQIILTDHDPAMKIAIDSVFSSARHRLCIWHIMDKVTTKLPYSVCNDGFKAKMSRIVWTDKLDEDVFDCLWESTISEYALEDNRWLTDMFELRQFWIPAYFRNWEMFGLMRTSSRSESENHMFNQLMSSSSTLVEFLTHFDTAMYKQRFNQSRNDHENLYTEPNLNFDWGLEKDAARIFTKSVFADICSEINFAINKCMSISFIESDGIKKFTIVDTSVVSTKIDESIDRDKEPRYFDEFFPIESEVLYNASLEEVSCSCKRYERFGRLCRHIFYAIRICKISHFPNKYICKRWTKNAVPSKVLLNPFNSVNFANEELGLNELIRLIYFNVEAALEKVIGNKDKLSNFLKAQQELLKVCEDEFDAADVMGNKEFIAEMLGVEQPESVQIHAPKGVRNKGSGSRKRITSSREKAISKLTTNSRKCGYCGSYDPHNIRTCPEKVNDDLKKKEAAMKKQAAERGG